MSLRLLAMPEWTYDPAAVDVLVWARRAVLREVGSLPRWPALGDVTLAGIAPFTALVVSLAATTAERVVSGPHASPDVLAETGAILSRISQ